MIVITPSSFVLSTENIDDARAAAKARATGDKSNAIIVIDDDDNDGGGRGNDDGDNGGGVDGGAPSSLQPNQVEEETYDAKGNRKRRIVVQPLVVAGTRHNDVRVFFPTVSRSLSCLNM